MPGTKTHDGVYSARVRRDWELTTRRPLGFARAGNPARVELARASAVSISIPPGGVPVIYSTRAQEVATMQVEIKEKPELSRGPREACSVRTNQIGEAFGRLDARSCDDQTGLLKPDTQMIAIYPTNDPESTAADQLRSDAASPVSSGDAVPKGLSEQRVFPPDGTPSARHTSAAYEKPRRRLGAIHWAEWLPASGHRIGDGVSYEVYLKQPDERARQAEAEDRKCVCRSWLDSLLRCSLLVASSAVA
jgi:DNA gyrase inhibitor GyrI